MIRHAIAVCSLVMLAACGGGGGGGESYAPPPSGKTLAFTVSPVLAQPEEQRTIDYDYDTTGLSGAITWSIAGGADQDLFSISSNGVLSFNIFPDNSNPRDANRDNYYQVTVNAEDSSAYGRWNFSIRVDQDLRDDYSVVRLTAGAEMPIYLTSYPDGSGRLLIVELGGQIELFDPVTGTYAAQKFLDVTSEIGGGGERGLLGFTLSPDFFNDGTFYVSMTNSGGHSELRRYKVMENNPLTADMTTREILLTIPESRPEHNANWIGFGPDGYLYWSVGDGGGAGDPERNGIDPYTLKATMLRLDVSGDDYPGDGSKNYAIPADNPFATSGGAPEVYVYGLRNPWRASFWGNDGNILLGDVGQDAREEINLIRPQDKGKYYGWNRREGTIAYNGGADDPSWMTPVAEYARGEPQPGRSSVTGGYVYTGRATPLRGKYIFGDFTFGGIWAISANQIVQGQTIPYDDFEILTDDFAPDSGSIGNIVSFGEDEFGNLYILDFMTGVYKVQPE